MNDHSRAWLEVAFRFVVGIVILSFVYLVVGGCSAIPIAYTHPVKTVVEFKDDVYDCERDALAVVRSRPPLDDLIDGRRRASRFQHCMEHYGWAPSGKQTIRGRPAYGSGA